MAASAPFPHAEAVAAAAGTVRVLYFAWLRERVGRAEETLDLTEGVTTVDELVAALEARSEQHRDAFAQRRSIRAAVNQEFAQGATKVRPGDEIAFFPPVTGG